MPKFTYVARDKEGKAFKDVVDATSQQALVEKLQRQGYFIVSIKQLATIQGPDKSKFKVNIKRKFAHKGVKLNDLLTFARQLATMLESGITLTRALGVILSQVESENLFKIITKVKKDVEQGGSLSISLGQHPKTFNQFWVSLIEVGEASGTVPLVLGKLAFYLEQQASFRSSIISGIIYPTILFFVSIGAVVFFALFVGPRFESIFKTMNVDLPVLTVILLKFFKFMKESLLGIAITIGVVIFLLKKYIKTYRGKLLFERFIFSLPIAGEIFRLIIVERFASQMSILIDSGVPILYALDITERLVDNNSCALIVSNVKERVREGELLVAPMERSGFFPPMCIQMIMVGEETGELSKMFKHIAGFYQNHVETFMSRFSTIIEPFMLVFMGGIIGTIVLAMFLPMFNLAQLGGASY